MKAAHKDRVVNFRMTASEYETVETMARAAGLSVSAYLRTQVTNAIGYQAARTEALIAAGNAAVHLAVAWETFWEAVRAVERTAE